MILQNIHSEFESFLKSNSPKIDSIHPTLEKSFSYLLNIPSKRFRPLLLLGTVDAYNENLTRNAFDVAYAIECIHTYSLIHDDLPCMDNSDLRRSKESTHIKFNEITALLTGDALNTYAFELLSRSSFKDSIKIKTIQNLSQNSGIQGMVLGQAIDCYFENTKLLQEEIEFLHINKTGKLIASSLSMAGIILEDEELEKSLYNIGIDLGLLFQIQDDILDVTSSSDDLGKPINNDKDKNSFVTILGIKLAQKRADELKTLVLAKINKLNNDKFSQNINSLIKKHL
ncbi:MAG: Octaprenyl diphosphate synthase (EC / Dimethylallyltransferase (EC / (2E,6E)-farnesyl diphosphate synthase (EC / Geranylgeranyl pyrophosphate synthetase (EC [uncultured Campylobacterales bacterium]|uniref:Octaprenyl diphosphate synthase -farnesyl diphosphate synthase ))) n=1 Tax=uncultured Campylobacterales bacterium TaxID=352960 RepID=A0A6S6S9Z6_9BACT|nr:MAG: Octaprenyl diphosphate synthase (EC / Dimethylallyltransferase (EC / (2E,6E)-farnesyl diphosphate synthase (EC / Geranylgeranyl pyrophosphate synthetase (EC [uncultured Campylobacterales bacterium]